jgi:hypothetical protein
MADEPDGSTVEMLRREVFDEIGRMAMMAEDYALKLFDSAEARDVMRVAGRLQQLRFCTMAMIQTFNLFLRKPHGQDVAEGNGSSHSDGEDQRSRDGVARREPQRPPGLRQEGAGTAAAGLSEVGSQGDDEGSEGRAGDRAAAHDRRVLDALHLQGGDPAEA